MFNIFLCALFLIVGMAYFFFVRKNLSGNPLSGLVTTTVSAICSLGFTISLLYGGWDYADPGYSYQVRSLTGKVSAAGLDKPGWFFTGFGSTTKWPKAISVEHKQDDPEKEEDAGSMYPFKVRMLDRVDGTMTQTTRFRLPNDEPTFLRMAEEYRSPENLLRTELIPSVEQVLNASASLMGAEDYFNGQRNQLQIDFDYQLRHGIYTVERKEQRGPSQIDQKASANATKGEKQDEYGTEEQVRFVVEKLRNADGSFITRPHNYKTFGISVIDAKLTDFDPNEDFVKRMKRQQQASADRAIAREQKIQEEEQRQLAIVKGQREIAEEQAKQQKDQIAKTTAAETDKQLALTEAEKIKEQARIQKEAAAYELERDKIKAQSQKVLADAEAYQKQAVMQADNALDKKLAAEIEIQKVWAEAFAKRNVPTTIIGGEGGSTDSDAKTFMSLLTVDAAKRLSYDRDLKK